MSFQKQKIIIIVLAGLILFAPFFASAGGLVPCGSNGEAPCNVKDIFVLIAKVTNYLIAMGGVFAVYQIINAGFSMITSLGNEEAITTQKNTITNAVIGLILTLFAFMVINTVVNVLLTRSLATGNPKCKIDLTNPYTYLTMSAAEQAQCSNLPDNTLHPPVQ